MFLSVCKGLARLTQRSRCTFTTVLAGVSCWASPAPAESLDFPAAREHAFARAGIADLSQIVLEASRARLAAAGALPNPSVFVEHETWRGGGLGDHDETAVGISTRLDFLWKRGARVESAQRESLIAELHLEARRHRLAHDLAALYLTYEYTDKGLQVLRASLHSLREARRIAAVRMERGDLPSSDLRRLDLAIRQVETEMVDLETQQMGTSVRLSALTGLPGVTPAGGWDPEPLPFSSSAAAVSAAEARNPDFRTLEAQARWLAAETLRARAEGRPETSLDVAYKSNSDHQSGAFVGISVEIPIFGGTRAQTRLARAHQRQAEMDAEQTRQVVAGEVAAAFHRWQQLRDMTADDGAASAQSAADEAYLRSASAAFADGEATVLEYADAVRSYGEAVRARLALIHQSKLATLHLAHLTGDPSLLP